MRSTSARRGAPTIAGAILAGSVAMGAAAPSASAQLCTVTLMIAGGAHLTFNVPAGTPLSSLSLPSSKLAPCRPTSGHAARNPELLSGEPTAGAAAPASQSPPLRHLQPV
jgi:hypothetical protein